MPPCETIHGLMVERWLFLCHVGIDDTHPDAVTTAFIAMAHGKTRVTLEHRHRKALRGLLVNRRITLSTGGNLHGGSDHAILAIRAKPALGAVISVGDATVARAYDYVQALGKMPIVVNDSRGFFTSRVFGTFVMERRWLRA